MPPNEKEKNAEKHAYWIILGMGWTMITYIIYLISVTDRQFIFT